jgi:RNA polymerase sigma-70 factor, ECF subfamily
VRTRLEEYVPRVYRLALRLTHDPHQAEDLTQETFLRAWKGQRELREPRAARVWLFRILVNLWRDQLRRSRSPVSQAGMLPPDQRGATLPPERQAALSEDARRALQALDELPGRQRDVVYLSACEELTGAEIASVLGISTEAVKANLCAARKKLRQRLRDLFEDLFPGVPTP